MAGRIGLSLAVAAICLADCRSGAPPEAVGPPTPHRSCVRERSASSPRHFLRFVDRSLEQSAGDDPCRALDLPVEKLVSVSGDQRYVHRDGRRARQPATCRDYLRLVDGGFHDEAPAASHTEQDLLRTCNVLDLLSRATQPTTSHLRDHSLASDGIDTLPLAVADVFADIDPAHRNQPLSAATEYLRCQSAVTDPRELCLYREPEDPGDRTVLMLRHIASGDFDRDGLGDVAVWASMGSGGPSQEYGTKLFILTRREPGRLLEIIAER